MPKRKRKIQSHGQVLPIADDSDLDEEGFPKTGPAYLRQVYFESKKYSDPVEAESLPKLETSTQRHEYQRLLCSRSFTDVDQNQQEWTSDVMKIFIRARQAIHNNIKLNNDKHITEWFEYSKNEFPTSSIISTIPQDATLNLVEKYYELLKKRELSTHHSLWLYCLLVRMDNLLEAEFTSMLRDLSKECLQLVNSCDVEETLLASLKVIIVIIASYFGQKDLGLNL
ncbi:hypothetical protein ROZALSC1DRAFT_20714 [Rozella allomycis CSF55]|uniref:Gem-associated protein 2 n=1 Tax=Rozella allomycis (strain CSF55) TaxID=988480 RepID=A0A4P9YQ77_ROZAC|nr:hypothetical protein ROZALSC1DRAFT_20710 [Rozella allomycis CSF55]RKP21217.1 hypothetical protein ROZALSC1DRAFT_20714 [Rozella allomycis CSF55]